MPIVPMPAPVTAASAPEPAAAVAPHRPVTPAAQIAPALLSLGQAANGDQSMTLRLQPAELGMVQVRIDRTAQGAAHITITVEKSDTMQALLHDQPQLHRVLDEAGVPVAGRTITFHAAPEPSPGGAGAQGSFQPASGGSNNGSRGGGHPGGQAGGGAGAGSGTGSGNGFGREQNDPPANPFAAANTIRSYHIGLNIMA
jgi:hypothetical protein